MQRSNVTVISVCYDSGGVVGAMVGSIPPETPIVLVDNGGLTSFPDFPANRAIEIVRLKENLGFGVGCNKGAALARTPYLLFLNPDSRLENGALDALLLAVERYPEASAFNPRITDENGGVSFKRRSYLLPRNSYMARGAPDEDCEVPILSGAAILVSKKLFDKVGGFDPEIFLYHEDDDLSLRLRAAGPLYFISDAHIMHAGGHSSGRSAKVAYLKAFHMAKSRIYAGRKHNRPAPLLFAYLEAFRLMISPITWFSARKRAKAAGFLAGILNRKA